MGNYNNRSYRIASKRLLLNNMTTRTFCSTILDRIDKTAKKALKKLSQIGDGILSLITLKSCFKKKQEDKLFKKLLALPITWKNYEDMTSAERINLKTLLKSKLFCEYPLDWLHQYNNKTQIKNCLIFIDQLIRAEKKNPLDTLFGYGVFKLMMKAIKSKDENTLRIIRECLRHTPHNIFQEGLFSIHSESYIREIIEDFMNGPFLIKLNKCSLNKKLKLMHQEGLLEFIFEAVRYNNTLVINEAYKRIDLYGKRLPVMTSVME